jgi:hypothetical protein
LWYKIKEIDPIYEQFLTRKQSKEYGLKPTIFVSQPEVPKNLMEVNRGEEQVEEMGDEDTVIFMIPSIWDSQSELPNHYHNPHKLP